MKSIALQFLISLWMTSAIIATPPVNLFNKAVHLTAEKYLFPNFKSQLGNDMISAPPTVSVSFTNPMTVNQQGTMTLTLTNDVGDPAQIGCEYTYTLPTGLNFPIGATVTNACGGTGTILGNTITLTNGNMASGMATCTLSVSVIAAAQGTIDPSTGSFSNPANVTADVNNGVGANPVNIVVNPAPCNANAGVLGY